jgi:hypothetical protein
MIFSSYQEWSVTAFSRPRNVVPSRKALNHSCHPFNPHFVALDIERLTVTLFPYKILQTKLVVVRLIDGALLPLAGYNRTICLEESVHWP